MADMECRLRMRDCQCGPFFKGYCAYKIPLPRKEHDVFAGAIAYQLTKILVIDMPTARAAVDAAMTSYWIAAGTSPTPPQEKTQ